MAVEVIIVAHYSIQAIDIFIQEITAANGWHLGDIVEFQVKNCAWESRVELKLKASGSYGAYEYQGKQIFQSGDREKMLADQNITQMVLVAYLSRHRQDQRPIHWL